MITEVYINDNLIDIEDEETVAATYGNMSFGKLSKRQGVKTNTWIAPFSPRNKATFESCEVQGSYSIVPYRRGTIRVEIQGVIVFEGFCTIDEAKENYEIQSFAGASDFYTAINNKKLSQLDLSQWAHVWNEVNIRNSWTNTQGYVYAFVEYGKNWPIFSNFPPEYLLPQLFFHSVVKQIATDAGYTLTGDVLTNPRFLTHLLIPNKFPLTIAYGSTWDLSTLLPDLTQSKVWIDFANIYGLQFDINEANGEIVANYIDDILFNDPEDWTTKIDTSEKPRKRYRIDNTYQSNFLRYKSETFNPAKNSGDAWQDFNKGIAIDDDTLNLSGDIYKSEFFLIQDANTVTFPVNTFTTVTYEAKNQLFYGIWRVGDGYINTGIVWHNGTYYQALQGSTGDDPPASPLFWKAVKESDVWEIKLRPMYGRLIIDPVSSRMVEFSTTEETVTRIVTNLEMDWEYTYLHHYRVFSRIIQKTKRVEPLVKLSYSDINQLDFTRLKKINNELYFLEEITQFHLNKRDSTICQLVRI